MYRIDYDLFHAILSAYPSLLSEHKKAGRKVENNTQQALKFVDSFRLTRSYAYLTNGYDFASTANIIPLVGLYFEALQEQKDNKSKLRQRQRQSQSVQKHTTKETFLVKLKSFFEAYQKEQGSVPNKALDDWANWADNFDM